MPVKSEKMAIINEPIIYGLSILFNETQEEYIAIISELEDSFEVKQVIARNKNKGSRLEEKYMLKL